MASPSSSRREARLTLFFGFLLWTISAALTLVLLVSLGDGSLGGKILLGTVAVGLEGSKILSWRKGGRARVYAIALIALSGIASIGASLQVVERSKGSFLTVSLSDLRSSPFYLAKTEELRSIDSEISVLVARLQTLPADYVTASTRIGVSISSLRDRKAALLVSIGKSEEAVGGDYSESNVIVLLAHAVGISPEIVLFLLLIFVAASIEAGALILTTPDEESRDRENQAIEALSEHQTGETTSPPNSPLPMASHAPPIDADTFLQAAKDGSDFPFLHGRDKTAEKLGISYAEAKRLVAKLIEDGRVVVDGKRLRLAAPTKPVIPPTSSVPIVNPEAVVG